MKTSARNQFAGTLGNGVAGAVNAEALVNLTVIKGFSPRRKKDRRRGFSRDRWPSDTGMSAICPTTFMVSDGSTSSVSLTKNFWDRSGLKTPALVKAPQIVIVTDFTAYKITARNQLPGIIRAAKPGTVNPEVELTGSKKIAATVTNDSAETPDLKEGLPRTAVFKAGSVFPAIAG